MRCNYIQVGQRIDQPNTEPNGQASIEALSLMARLSTNMETAKNQVHSRSHDAFQSHACSSGCSHHVFMDM